MGGMAETSAQEKLQVEEACADFVARYPGYKKTRVLDDLRATEYRRLDERGQVYLDYTGGSLYAESQLQKHLICCAPAFSATRTPRTRHRWR